MLFGGGIGLLAAVVYPAGLAIVPGVRPWILVAVAVAITVAGGSVAGWLFARREIGIIRRLQGVVGAMTKSDFGPRVRTQSTGPLGDLGHSVDALADRLTLGQKKKDSRRERLGTILDAMSEAVLVTDASGRITLCNEVLESWVGLGVEGKTAVEAIRHPDFQAAIEKAQDGASSVIDIELDGADGASRRSLRASVAPLRSGRGVVGVLSDVSAERAADQVRRDFVANAGHELRTPLTAIRGFAETLRETTIDDPEAARGFLDVILRHTHRLQALVDDLADLSRFEGGDLELELEPVAPGAIVLGVVRGLESQTQAKNLNVVLSDFEGASNVLAEERALEQVLVNLVDNAIKYTPEGGEVRLTISNESGGAVIEVANTGPTIPGEHLPRIFERFYRVDPGRSRELGGTGLGLSIVKHLVVKLGGEITADSQEGWTRFRLRLPHADSLNSDTLVSQS